MTSANDLYRGLSLDEATRRAQQAGFQVAVEMVGQQVLNNEYRPGRITFKVKNGIVESAKLG